MKQHCHGTEKAEELSAPPLTDWSKLDSAGEPCSDRRAYLRSAFIGIAWCAALFGLAGLLAWCDGGRV